MRDDAIGHLHVLSAVIAAAFAAAGLMPVPLVLPRGGLGIGAAGLLPAALA